MPAARWLPMRYRLPGSLELGRLIYTGNEWQIYEAEPSSWVLLVAEVLVKRWDSLGGFPEGAFQPVVFGSDTFHMVASDRTRLLVPVDAWTGPQSKADALAFIQSLSGARSFDTTASLHDAIYIERYSCLLPTWTISEAVSDDIVIGTWLTGGVSVSVHSVRRLSQLLGWLSPSDIQDIIRSASDTSNIRSSSTRENQSKSLAGRFDPSRVETSPDQQFRLPGRPHLEQFFNEYIVDIVHRLEQYKALGVTFPAATILYGPPGCGKTYAVERLMEFLDWPVFHVESSSVGSPYIHETSRKVAEVFDRAIEGAPSAIIIDEMEAFLANRLHDGSTGLHHVEEVAEFLRRIPEATGKRVLVFGMTNQIDMIDPAILRRGRFDHVLEVGMPSVDEVSALLSTLIAKVPVEPNLKLDDAIHVLVNRPLSDAAFVIREAGRLAARAGSKVITQSALGASLERLPRLHFDQNERRIGFGAS